MVLSHFKELELYRCRVVTLRPVDLEELLEPVWHWLRRLRPVSLLPGKKSFLILLMDYVVGLIVLIKSRIGTLVHKLKPRPGIGLRVAIGAGLHPCVQTFLAPVSL